jgi:hypothetical protein
MIISREQINYLCLTKLNEKDQKQFTINLNGIYWRNLLSSENILVTDSKSTTKQFLTNNRQDYPPFWIGVSL